MVKCEQISGSDEITQTTIFSPTDDGKDKDPSLSTFVFPQKAFQNSASDQNKPETNFVFYLKGGDDSTPTYGYVYSFIEKNKRLAYCIISQYYDPPKYYDLAYKVVGKSPIEISSFINNSESKTEINTVLNEETTIQKGLFEFCCLFDFTDLGKLIAFMLLDSKIIIAGSDIGKISRCAFGLLSAIHPIPWPGAYIPILPDSMIDAIYAPFPYLIGIHSHLIPETESPDVEGHVLVDLDKKKIAYYPEELPLPSKVMKEIDEFKKKILQSQLNHEFLQKRLRKLILNIVSIALSQPPNRPDKLYKHWEKMRTLTKLDDFTMLICQSQLVLQLMRIIEEGPESDRYKKLFPAIQQIQRSDGNSFITRAKQSISKRVSMRAIYNPKNILTSDAKHSSVPPIMRTASDGIKEEPKSVPPSRSSQQPLIIASASSSPNMPPIINSSPPSSPPSTSPLSSPSFSIHSQVKNPQKAAYSTSLFNQIIEVATQFEKRKITIDEMLRQKKEEQMRIKRESEILNPEGLQISSKIELYNSGSTSDENVSAFKPQLRRLPPSADQRPKSARIIKH